MVEDSDDIFEYYKRFFDRLLAAIKVDLVRVGTIQDALGKLKDDWDFILMDFELGESAMLKDLRVRNGAELVNLRRSLEKERMLKSSYVIGISSSDVYNDRIARYGANDCFLKIDVERVAGQILARGK